MKRYVVGSLFVGAATLLAWFNLAAAGVFIVAVVLVAMSSRASEFGEFAVGPLKAKLKERITEASELVETLKRLSVLQAQASVAASARMGRFLDQDAWPYEMMVSFLKELDQLDLTEADRVSVQSELVRFTKVDILFAILGSYAPSQLGEGWREWERLRDDPYNWDPDRVEAFLRQHDLLSPEREMLLADYKWIAKEGRIRDREQFLRSKVHHDIRRA